MQSFKKLDSRLTQTLESTSLSPFNPKYSLGAKTGHKYAQRLLNRGSCFSQTKGRSITKKVGLGGNNHYSINQGQHRDEEYFWWEEELKRHGAGGGDATAALASASSNGAQTNEGVLQVVLEQRDEQHDPDAGWHAQDL